jgi:hypothetical protein
MEIAELRELHESLTKVIAAAQGRPSRRLDDARVRLLTPSMPTRRSQVRGDSRAPGTGGRHLQVGSSCPYSAAGRVTATAGASAMARLIICSAICLANRIGSQDLLAFDPASAPS